MKTQILIAGGSGLIGSALKQEALKQGWEVTILSRREGNGHLVWDPQNGVISLTEPRVFDAIVNLAGTSIAGGRWTQKRKKEIVQSRVDACHTIEKYLIEGILRTKVYIGASAIGIYGDSGNDPVDETTSIVPNDDWMIKTVQEWEAGHKRIEALGIRTVIIRIGIVLTLNGGALKEMLQTAFIGILGFFGNGNQIWSWIHIDDLVDIITMSITNDKMKGLYLAVTPHPVSNKDLTIVASRQYSPRRIVLPVPAFVLSILLGSMHRMLMISCNGYPSGLLNSGFKFKHAQINDALSELFTRDKEVWKKGG